MATTRTEQPLSGADLLQEVHENGLTWIKDKEGLPMSAIRWAEAFGRYLAKDSENKGKLTPNQFRNIYGKLKKIQGLRFDKPSSKTDFRMLHPQMAHIAGKDQANKRKTKVQDLVSAFSPFIDTDEVETSHHFQNLVYLFEATVAYHKAFE
jgi:CRISPR type III-A-associated protein Csm2